ncbi:42834_t:CDS:1, partial [Gigaspora margarita]
LQDDWKIKIDTEIDSTYLTPPRSIDKLHQSRELKIIALQQPNPPKRPIETDPTDEFFPTRMPDNASPIRNANGNPNVQISFIVDEYKRTLNADDKKKFNRIKMNHVKEMIKDAHTKSSAKKSLLDILYYSWVLGKDDTFLLTKYTQTKINANKMLVKNIDDYI